MPDTNQSPLAVTDDAFKASRLERMLSNFTASYKIYFLKAVFDAAVSGESRVAYDRLAASMVASAWYPVLFFRLNLGATDQLARVVYAAHARLALDRSASRGDVVAAAPFEQARKRSLGEARPRPQGPRDSVGSQGEPTRANRSNAHFRNSRVDNVIKFYANAPILMASDHKSYSLPPA